MNTTRLYILIAGFSGCLLTSCSEDLLNLTPESENVLNSYYKDQAQLEKGVNAAYGALQYTGQYGLANMVLGELPSDNTWDEVPANDGGNYGQLDLFNMTSSNSIIDDSWRDNYKGIQQCNVVLNRVDGTDAPDTDKKRIKGEMQFLRALMYFNLVRTFGDVPLVTKETVNPNDYFEQGRTPKADVYKQITTDLTEAVNLLPKKPSEAGRVSKGAALALLGKVYLTLHDYTNSLLCLKEVEKLGYELLPDPASVFDVDNKDNQEIIFSVQFASGLNGNTEGSSAFMMFSPSGTVSGAKGHNLPTKDVYNLFADTDKRKAAYFYVTKDGVIGSNKLQQTSDVVADGGSNIVVLRYADVLLMIAECDANKGDAAGIAEANTYLNQIKTRAGIPTVQIADKTKLLEEIALERRKELVNEGERWFDLVRTGKAIEVMNTYFARTPGYNGITVKEQNFVQPVPQNQINTDAAIKQNEGYN